MLCRLAKYRQQIVHATLPQKHSDRRNKAHDKILTDDSVGVVCEVAQAALQAPQAANAAFETETRDGRAALVLTGTEREGEGVSSNFSN